MTSRIANIARKSVVIVADNNDTDGYCSGCVLRKTHRTVTIITSKNFVLGIEDQLKVIFFDRIELQAIVVAVDDTFCLLVTDFHRDCEAIKLMENEDSLVPGPTFMFAPISQTANQRLTTFATVELLSSYTLDEIDLEEADSSNYFLVSCPYMETTCDGIDRLVAAPVFNLQGNTAGIVLECLRDVNDEPQAAEIKIVLKASYIDEIF
ncbi:unnamed protein product [Urochloa decumbens]|uniref:Uncharacterized protein n=2 Tax=Urochloa decumbens TaxID=240449 RepID=A0ABC9DRK1_9POAL